MTHFGISWTNTACGGTGPWARDITLVDCPLCHLTLEHVPVVPGKDHTMRPARPAYIHPGSRYVPLELATTSSHRAARTPRRGIKALIGVAAGVALSATALAVLADDPEPQDQPRPTLSSSVPQPAPPPPGGDDIVGMDIIWTVAR